MGICISTGGMNIAIKMPGPMLRPYIKHYWQMLSNGPTSFKDTLLPASCFELVFNIGNADINTTFDKLQFKTKQTETIGLLTAPAHLHFQGQANLIGIKFWPHTFRLLFDCGPEALVNAGCSADEIAGIHIQTLFDGVAEHNNDPFNLLEKFLLLRLKRTAIQKTSFVRMQQTMAFIHDSTGCRSVTDVAHYLNVTPRYIEKLFAQYVGIRPAMYLRLKRFEQALKACRQQQPLYAAIAFDQGYSDQSHLIREFKSFAHTLPTTFKATDNSVSNALR